MSICALLIDTVSIQRYVFGSNKLKENLGASYLIQEVYRSHLQDVITDKVFPSWNFDFNAWREKPGECSIKNGGVPFEIGYIGGGKALLLFTEQKKAAAFIEEWTKTLLVETPGIVTAMACEEFDLDKFEEENKGLFRKLQENKYKFIPQTVIPRHGITAECSHTGYSMEVWNDKVPGDEQNYVSSVAYAKNRTATDANKRLEREFVTELGSDYCFTDQLDKLGQSKGEDSHIAIVHIDGNGMGQRFQRTKGLKHIRNLSKDVKKATEESFRTLLKEIISQFCKIEEALGFDTPEKKKKYPTEGGKKILPLRPIIIGGDDITFVSDGKLGIHFAKIFMEAFEKQTVSDSEQLSSCAGIAITKTKYPFYRGYELSEQLCNSAKKIRKNKEDNGSWLDFHIAFGGFSGTLKEIRESHYRAAQGDLLFRPYKIGNHHEYGFDTLVKNIRVLKNNVPNSKIKEMRQVLTLGKEYTERFAQEMEARGLKVPKISGKSYENSLYEETKTPYFDMIELMEFYPSFELQQKQSGGETA